MKIVNCRNLVLLGIALLCGAVGAQPLKESTALESGLRDQVTAFSTEIKAVLGLNKQVAACPWLLTSQRRANLERLKKAFVVKVVPATSEIVKRFTSEEFEAHWAKVEQFEKDYEAHSAACLPNPPADRGEACARQKNELRQREEVLNAAGLTLMTPVKEQADDLEAWLHAEGSAFEKELNRLLQFEVSSAEWVKRFPVGQSVDDLAPEFRAKVEKFLAALKKAGAAVKISATYLPPERAHLQHHAWQIARGDKPLDPREVPAQEGVEINWLHPKDGAELTQSRAASEQMVRAFALTALPPLTSRFTERRAIAMTITWDGELKIEDANGRIKTLDAPQSHSNPGLHEVAASYGVIKRPTDPPSWSEDGK